ncbi:hypothetical protein ABTE52_22125, partial [Acinetobacter baumannii]
LVHADRQINEGKEDWARMKLKLLFWLLLVGNVVLFGMSRGYFGANASERREPQRLAEQLRPELLSVLPANSDKLASQLRAQP